MKLSSPKQPIETKEGCLATCMEILGNKWTALILRDLAIKPQRFSELERSIPGMSPRTLSQRLDDLEEQKIVTKRNFNEVPPHIEYALTQKGEDLVPVLKQMAELGDKYYTK